MKILKAIVKYFSIGEILLWGFSTILIIASFCLFDKSNYLTLVASLTGVTSLIFNAKGNPIGQVLMIIFSLVHGYISFIFKYYGEMLTYVCMTMPMAVFALVSWLTPPFKGNKAEVEVNKLKKNEPIFMWFLTIIIIVIFYVILRAFNTKTLFLVQSQ